MWFRTLIGVILLGISLQLSAVQRLPQAIVDIEQSSVYGQSVSFKYSNWVGIQKALALELANGPREFRLNGTYVALFRLNHLFKLTAEYLSQQTQFHFLPGANLQWTEQHVIALGYSYLFGQGPCSINTSLHQGRSRDEALPAIYGYDDETAAIYRNVKGASFYGATAGLAFKPWSMTEFELTSYFDAVNYRQGVEGVSNRTGIGFGTTVTQQVSKILLLSFSATTRSLYDQYQASVSWLNPCGLQNLGLSVQGQYLSGELPAPNEKRIRLMLTYQWQRPSCSPCMTQGAVSNTVSQPLVHMPEILVARDQVVIGR